MSDKTLREEQEELREAWRDLMWELGKPLARLIDKIPGLKLKPQYRERQIRDEWKAASRRRRKH